MPIISPGDYVQISSASKSKHAGKVGIVRNWKWSGSSSNKAFVIEIPGVKPFAIISCTQLRVINCDEYNNIQYGSPKQETSPELYYVMVDDVTDINGPHTLEEAERQAADAKEDNPSAHVIILRAIKEAKNPRRVVDFDNL
ncbi:MAG: hypothetical protein ACRCWQ_02750 [Bacilli bacterium]